MKSVSSMNGLSVTKLLVVGMNPSNTPALAGRVNKNSTFDRLHKWMDALGVHHFSFCNTFDYPKNNPKRSDVDFNTLALACSEYDRVVCLGGFASVALNSIGVRHFRLPHPSPRNRVLNDKAVEAQELKLCKEYLDESFNNHGSGHRGVRCN